MLHTRVSAMEVISVLAWAPAIAVASLVGWNTQAWLAALFFLASATASLRSESSERPAPVLVLLGPILLLACSYAIELIGLITGDGAVSVPPALVLTRLMTQGLASAVFVGWFFRAGWLLPIAMLRVFAPVGLERRLHNIALHYPLAWWWKATVAFAAAKVVIALSAYGILLWTAMTQNS